MQRVDAERQKSHWDNRRHYRDPRSAAGRAFAEPKIKWLAEHLDIGPESSVLDVGAGNGMFTMTWKAFAGHVEGIELSENMIARSPCPESIRQGDAYELPYPDASFDLVFTGNVLHHLERPVDALQEMARVSRSAVAICEGNRNHLPMGAFGVVSQACRGVLSFSLRHLEQLAVDAGLQVVAIRPQGYVYENRSPEMLLPLARRIEQRAHGGAYLLLAARKPA